MQWVPFIYQERMYARPHFPILMLYRDKELNALTLYQGYSVRPFAVEGNSVAIEISSMHQYSAHDVP